MGAKNVNFVPKCLQNEGSLTQIWHFWMVIFPQEENSPIIFRQPKINGPSCLRRHCVCNKSATNRSSGIRASQCRWQTRTSFSQYPCNRFYAIF